MTNFMNKNMVKYIAILEKNFEDEDIEDKVTSVVLRFMDEDDGEEIASYLINFETYMRSVHTKMVDSLTNLNIAIDKGSDVRCTFKDSNGLIEIEVKNGRVKFTVSNYEGAVMGDLSVRFKLNESLALAFLDIESIARDNLNHPFSA